ncbi:hypothetical protein HG530_012163 [Fusarium avenaceum]|nr:hypothetical protein HG530_012163 [Fusarium avenaceum]
MLKSNEPLFGRQLSLQPGKIRTVSPLVNEAEHGPQILEHPDQKPGEQAVGDGDALAGVLDEDVVDLLEAEHVAGDGKSLVANSRPVGLYKTLKSPAANVFCHGDLDILSPHSLPPARHAELAGETPEGIVGEPGGTKNGVVHLAVVTDIDEIFLDEELIRESLAVRRILVADLTTTAIDRRVDEVGNTITSSGIDKALCVGDFRWTVGLSEVDPCPGEDGLVDLLEDGVRVVQVAADDVDVAILLAKLGGSGAGCLPGEGIDLLGLDFDGGMGEEGVDYRTTLSTRGAGDEEVFWSGHDDGDDVWLVM